MPRSSYRIAHFGDLHLEERDEEFDWILYMVEDAFERGAHHVVFTGDIVDAADVDIIEDLMDELEGLGCGPRDFSLVPGNHDIYPLSWPLTLDGVWRAANRQSQENWERVLELIDRNMDGIRSGALLDDETLPYSKHLAPGVVLIGLDSTRSDSTDPTDWAAGELDENAVAAAADHVASLGNVVHCVVAMHHYPLNDFENVSEHFPLEFQEPDAGTVRGWLRQVGATSVLCGHIHEDRERRIAGGVRVFATDSNIYDVDEDEGITARSYRLVTLHPKGGVTTRLVEVSE